MRYWPILFVQDGWIFAAPCKEIRILESVNCLLIESGILGFGIRNTAQTRNPESHKRLESRIQVPLAKTGIQYLESGIHDVESWIQHCLGFPYCGDNFFFAFLWTETKSRTVKTHTKKERGQYPSIFGLTEQASLMNSNTARGEHASKEEKRTRKTSNTEKFYNLFNIQTECSISQKRPIHDTTAKRQQGKKL